MNDLLDGTNERYAILEQTRGGGGGRFVVAYRNEYLLRDLIAPSCIAAFGFSSREEAVARTEPNVSTNRDDNEEREHGARQEQQSPERRASSQTIRRFLGALYDDAVATAIVAFSSRNVISVTIRRLLTV